MLYDIRNVAWVEGDVYAVEDSHLRHQVQDIGEDGNVDRVTRVLDLSYSECVEILYPYTKRPVHGEVGVDNTLDAQHVYLIELSLPSDYSVTTVMLLKKLIHEYMVSRVLADWLSITLPSRSSHWEEVCESLRVKIRDSLNARIGRTRLSLSPF